MPTVSVYIRTVNYERLRRAAEKKQISVGHVINQLIESYLREFMRDHGSEMKPSKGSPEKNLSTRNCSV